MLEISVYQGDISNVADFQISVLNRNDVVHMNQSKILAQCTHFQNCMFHQQSILSASLISKFFKEKYSGLSLLLDTKIAIWNHLIKIQH